MKTVELWRDFVYVPHPRLHIHLQGGITYRRVIEACASAIVAADAGRVLDPAELHSSTLAPGSSQTVDTWHVWQRRRRRA